MYMAPDAMSTLWTMSQSTWPKALSQYLELTYILHPKNLNLTAKHYLSKSTSLKLLQFIIPDTDQSIRPNFVLINFEIAPEMMHVQFCKSHACHLVINCKTPSKPFPCTWWEWIMFIFLYLMTVHCASEVPHMYMYYVITWRKWKEKKDCYVPAKQLWGHHLCYACQSIVKARRGYCPARMPDHFAKFNFRSTHITYSPWEKLPTNSINLCMLIVLKAMAY